MSRRRWRRCAAARRSIWCSNPSPERKPPTASFGIYLAMLEEAREQALALKRGTRGEQRDVFRNRPGQRAFGQRAPWRGSANLRSARLCRRAPVPAAAGEYRGRFHRARISVRWQANPARRAGRSFLRQAAGPAHGLRRLLHQPRRSRPGRHGRAAHAARRGGRELHHGRARRGRHHAELPEHLVSRRAVSAAASEAAARAGIRSLAGRAAAELPGMLALLEA